MRRDQKEPARWWGEYRIEEDLAGRWRIGPLTLWIERLQHEWRVAKEIDTEASEDVVEVSVPVRIDDILGRGDVARFALARTANTIWIEPALADRPVITSPEKPFHVPAGESVRVYVGSPLWIRLATGSPPVPLEEFPVVKPNDTWFGPSTREGVLCYASRTHARLDVANLPRRPHRAVTAVLVRNTADTPLKLDRMELPTPHLSLYATSDGHLWTQDVTLERTEDGENAALQLNDAPPSAALRPVLVSRAREEAPKHLVLRAFGSLFT